MNSKQRRNLTRKLKYHITLGFDSEKYIPAFDDHIDRAIKWCRSKTTGAYTVDIESFYEKVIFSFEKECDAIIFTLKWQ